MAALAGVGAGGVLGGITGSLISLGIPEYEAKRYEGRVKKGGILNLGSLRRRQLDEESQNNPG